jgi:hypothetical protein
MAVVTLSEDEVDVCKDNDLSHGNFFRILDAIERLLDSPTVVSSPVA